MDRIIIHVDMDAFFASVETRDNPGLRGKPLIIGALPGERGVVATCSYEARKYGIHSAMNIKEAYQRCPNGIYKRPDMEKYQKISRKIRKIWNSYTPLVQTVALDEAYLDVTEQAGDLESARNIARNIKKQIKSELGLTCSVGIAYSKTAAKAASEERKPDGFYEIPTAEDYVNLIIDRDVRALYTVGEATARKLGELGIHTVRDVQNNRGLIVDLLGKQGERITKFSFGYDDREVIPNRPQDAKSISREVTFQEDVTNYELLKDVLVLLSLCVERRAKRYNLYGGGVTLKIIYDNRREISRSAQIITTNSAVTIWRQVVKLLDNVEKRPVRLIGVGIHNLTNDNSRQLSFIDVGENSEDLKPILRALDRRYGLDFTGNIDKIFQARTLHKTVEYMRKHS